jgi:hypothetical protein
MLAIIRDRNCNMILAHTSLADLGQELRAITDNTVLNAVSVPTRRTWPSSLKS